MLTEAICSMSLLEYEVASLNCNNMDDDFFLQPTKTYKDLFENDSESRNISVKVSVHEAKSFSVESDERERLESGRVSLKAPELCLDFVAGVSVHGKEKKPGKNTVSVIDSEDNGKRPTLDKEGANGDSALEFKDKLLKTLKFFVKKGRVFEIRKITRKIQFLRKRKGNEKETDKNNRKITSHLATIDVMKNICVDSVCNKLFIVLQGIFEKIKLEIHEPHEKFHWLEVLSNSFGSEEDLEVIYCLRFLHFRSVMDRFDGEIRGHFEKYIGLSQVSEKDGQMSYDIDYQSKNKEPKSKKTKKRSISLKKNNRKVKDNKGGEKQESSQKYQNKICGVNEEKAIIVDKSRKNLKYAGTTCCHNNICKKRNQKKEAETTVKLDSDKLKLKKFKVQLQKIKNRHGNRLGQRARRELWEKMYGKDAIHVRKGVKSRQKPKQGKNQCAANSGLFNGRKSSPQNVQYKEKMNLAEENLHPSWQAKKQQKQQNQIVQFQGSKVKFDD